MTGALGSEMAGFRALKGYGEIGRGAPCAAASGGFGTGRGQDRPTSGIKPREDVDGGGGRPTNRDAFRERGQGAARVAAVAKGAQPFAERGVGDLSRTLRREGNRTFEIAAEQRVD
ncbi:hypothetical protein TP2_03015 [Thioclava pacifica DSM 10166]|uniref:Uncharacterized protein n=1 Tax=Thioclava pacifica DSM 10166 TaxID=1353537 RepID=A0A074JJ41_9RHOB|nr:hypothetical protein TP2_03015 [Thioclava pacifica DSM 10166]